MKIELDEDEIILAIAAAYDIDTETVSIEFDVNAGVIFSKIYLPFLKLSNYYRC